MSAPESAFDLLPDGVVVADAAGQVTTANDRAAHLLGRPRDEIVGSSVFDALPLQDEHGRDWLRCAEPYAGLRSRTALVERAAFLPDGTELLVTARLHRDRRGGEVHSVVVSMRSARQRGLLERERSDLIATIAHELRSPLTGVKGFVSTLLTKWDRLNEQQKLLMLETVHSDSARLSRLITELLDVARIDTGRLSLYPRSVDVRTSAERVLASVGQATSRPLELVAPESVPTVHMDPDKLTQVLTNLVENAVKHGEGTVTLTLREAEGRDGDGAWPGVLVQVDDEGEGIPEEIRSRVFTKFWTSGIRGGSGLGLYIVRGLTRAHGGDVTIGSTPDGGASLRVLLPREDRRGR